MLYFKSVRQSLIAAVAFLTLTSINSFTPPLSTKYPYWPSYQYLEITDLDTIQPQKWIENDHVIDGWDWSLPDDVEPAPNSLVGLQRIIGLNKEFKPLSLQFKSNSVGILWVKWRDIEPIMGQYDFQPVIDRINQAKSAGSEIILRFLCHSYSRGNGADSLKRGEAPLWLKEFGVPFLPKEYENRPSDNLNFDPSNPVFHERYLKFVEELGKTNIPQVVKAAYVGYASHSFGDEGIGPHGETNTEANDTEQHVRDRLDAWEQIFAGMTHKVFMGGTSYYGFSKGFGTRRGFVEMYMYRIPNKDMGQFVDENNYLYVDENSPIISNGGFHGEVNEEYEAAWATKERNYRFGNTTESYPYRYFTSTLRALQMRCTYIHTTGHLMPKMLPFLSLELGRTVNDSPDVWTFLRTSYLKEGNFNESKNNGINLQHQNNGVEVKNLERWLYQRDAVGYETEPALKIEHPIEMWMIKPDNYFDYIARKGQKIGFDIDDRWLKDNGNFALKVSYYDGVSGTLKVVYRDNEGMQERTVVATGEDKVKTATFIINGLLGGTEPLFDFELHSEEEVPVIFVRMIKSRNNTSISQKEEEDNGITIYPNPFNNFLNVSCDSAENSELSIYNVMGGKIYYSSFNNHLYIDTSGWQSGIYFATVEGSSVIKLLKQ